GEAASQCIERCNQTERNWDQCEQWVPLNMALTLGAGGGDRCTGDASGGSPLSFRRNTVPCADCVRRPPGARVFGPQADVVFSLDPSGFRQSEGDRPVEPLPRQRNRNYRLSLSTAIATAFPPPRQRAAIPL